MNNNDKQIYDIEITRVKKIDIFEHKINCGGTWFFVNMRVFVDKDHYYRMRYLANIDDCDLEEFFYPDTIDDDDIYHSFDKRQIREYLDETLTSMTYLTVGEFADFCNESMDV